jgi:branched-subunit amino acid aminotransferase/4-amino-4-deoxychorismate lyase
VISRSILLDREREREREREGEMILSVYEVFRYCGAEKKYVNVDLHMERLNGSIEKLFGKEVMEEKGVVEMQLQQVKAHLDGIDDGGDRRICVTVSEKGKTTIDVQEIDFSETRRADPSPPLLCIDPRPSLDGFDQKVMEMIAFKTTKRDVYFDAMMRVVQLSLDLSFHDVVLHNRKGEITETTQANIAILVGTEWLTPPLSCGVFPGVMRRILLEEKLISERVITISDLKTANNVICFNSVDGITQVRVHDPNDKRSKL